MALTKITGQVINDTTGLVVGVTTVGGGLSATDGFFSGIVTASGNLTVGGVLTYEDVTNVDSVGLITARNGIVVGSGITLSKDGDIFATGITTISENLKVGTGVTISPDGDGFYTGVVTATTFKGDGSQLSNVSSTTINTNAANRVVTGSGTANTLNANSDLLWNGSRLDIDTGGTEDALRIGSSSGADTFIRLGSTGTATDTHAVIKYDIDDNNLSLIISGESHGSGGIRILNGGNVEADDILPFSNNAYDLGSSSVRWRNIYSNDLNLSNEGNKNDVDGTWGNYTIQEGENDLFLINNRSGKKYKFNLTEVS